MIKRIAIILLLLIACEKEINIPEEPIPIEVATYYVSTTGSDSNTGTFSSPWATWQYAFNQISAGDILYVRGGTYTPTLITTTSSRNCAVAVSGKNGTVNNPYRVEAYQSEVPILDCRNITGSNERIGILILNSSYWHLKGLRVTRVDQPSSGGVGGQGIFIWGISSATYNTIENCKAYVCGGPGMGTRNYVNETLFLNCDAYDNWDAYSSSPGGNADGYDVGYSSGIRRFVGCRAWHNGDDGFDMYDHSPWEGVIYLTNCWAWHHGYSPTDGAGGDGSGFKLGTSTGLQTDGTTRRYLYNCIAYDNKNNGYDQNSGNTKTNIYNSIAYANSSRGFDFHWENQYDTFRNCISFGNGSSDGFLSNVTHDHNSWDSGVTASSADFVSVTGSQLEGARQANGNLPVLTFLHLTAGSDLIAKGSTTGIYATDGDGNAWSPTPSMGPFEYAATGHPALGNIIKLGQLYAIGGVNFTINANMFLVDDDYTAPVGVRIPTTGTFTNCSRVSQYVLLPTNPTSDSVFTFPIEYTSDGVTWYSSSIAGCVVYKSLPTTNLSTLLIGTTLSSASRSLKDLCTSVLVNKYSLYCPSGSAPYKMSDFKYYTHGASGGTYVSHIAPTEVSTFNELYTIRGLCSKIFKEITNAPYSLSRVCIYKGSTWMAATEMDLTSVHGGYVDLIQQNTATTPTVTTWYVKSEHFYGGAWVVETTESFTITTDS